jgi:hypothetical protein
MGVRTQRIRTILRTTKRKIQRRNLKNQEFL